MGNLRDKYTDEEWDDLDSKIKEDKKNGKPDFDLIHLSFGNLPLDKQKAIRLFLSSFFDDFDLSEMDSWIKWNELNTGVN